MTTWVILSSLGFLPQPVDHVVQVDVIELNHLLQPCDGSVILEQWVLWDRCKRTNQYRVVAWKMYSDGVVRLRKRPGGWELHLRNNKGKHWYVRAPEFRETFTFKDPEVANRKEWPIDWRRGLKVISTHAETHGEVEAETATNRHFDRR